MKALPFVREIHFFQDESGASRSGTAVILFWFFHHPTKVYVVSVIMSQLMPTELGRSGWRESWAQGHEQGSDVLFHCYFNEEGEAIEVQGEFPYPSA